MNPKCVDLFQSLDMVTKSFDADMSLQVMWNGVPQKVRFHLPPGATQLQIEKVEEKLKVTLPQSFKVFLSCWNGAGLYMQEFYIGYEVLGTESLIEQNLEARKLYSELWRDGAVFFCDIDDSDYIGFDTLSADMEGECPVLDCFHEAPPREWRVIAHNFSEWLDGLIKAQGLQMFWGKE